MGGNSPELKARVAKAKELIKNHVAYRDVSQQVGIGQHRVLQIRKEMIASGEYDPDKKLLKDPVACADAEREKLERREYVQLHRKKTLYEIVGSMLADAIKAYPEQKPVRPAGLNLKATQDAEDIVMLWSDSHVGSSVDARESGGLGGYNVETFLSRLEFLKQSLKKIFEIHLTNTPCPSFNVFFLGDIVDGADIFPGHARQVEIGAARQVVVAVEQIARFIEWAARIYNWHVNCYCVVGNHGRVGRKGEQSPLNNFDYLVYRWLGDKLANYGNVNFHVSNSWWMLVERMGWRYLLEHGDDARAWMGFPFYSTERIRSRNRDMFLRHGEAFDFYVCGHHHQEAVLNGGTVFANGAWPGGSEYSIKSLKMCGKPTQMLQAVHPEFGVTWTRSIQLDAPGNIQKVDVYK